MFESYKLHRLYGNLDYYALGSISFTFPTKNFESCFQDDLYGGFTPGRSP
ncbi:MAG: hypothetical protein LBI53_06465 [Candidatus Peribacteria bacterium]|nr:hypothetical protein [Candidatus Peribacteria bacterium]